MIFDEVKVLRARAMFRQIAWLCFNGVELTEYQQDTMADLMKVYAEQEHLVNEHILRRVAS